MNQCLSNPIEIVQYVIEHFYVEENIENIIQYLTDDVVWMENEIQEICKGKEMLQKCFKERQKEGIFNHLEECSLDIIWEEEGFLLVGGRCMLHVPGMKRKSGGIVQNCTAFLIYTQRGYCIRYMHLSIQEKKNCSTRSLMIRAQCDSLTGIYNIRAAKEWIEHWLEINQRNKGCSMFMVDVDNFKHINDTYGHLKGNEILIKVARMLKRCVKHKGIVGRVGGDEFLVFLKTGVQMEIIEFAEHLLWESQNLQLENKEPITISIGIGAELKAQSTFEVLFRQADEALYEAKAMGKNDYIIYRENKKERDV